jgi:type IV secretion system protein VirB11
VTEHDRQRREAEAYFLHELMPLLGQPGVTDVCVNEPGEAWVQDSQGWRRYEAPNLTYAVCLAIARRIANRTMQEFSAERPLLSATLVGGERVQVVGPPVAPAGTVALSVRRPSADVWGLEDLRALGMLEADQAAWLASQVQRRRNILVSGGMGSGKTTLVKALCLEVPLEERVITIEDAPELVLPHRNKLQHFYSAGGQGIAHSGPEEVLTAVTREAPTRIIVGEVRDRAAGNYVMALNLGHAGCITTIHANSCGFAVERMATLAMMTDYGRAMGHDEIVRMVKTLVPIGVHCAVVEGKRKVTEIVDREAS